MVGPVLVIYMEQSGKNSFPVSAILAPFRQGCNAHKSTGRTWRGRLSRQRAGSTFGVIGPPSQHQDGKKALRKADTEIFRWHHLRHACANWLSQQSVPSNVIQEMGAWESAEMVRRYARLRRSGLADMPGSWMIYYSTAHLRHKLHRIRATITCNLLKSGAG